MSEVAFKILRGGAVTQNALGGLIKTTWALLDNLFTLYNDVEKIKVLFRTIHQAFLSQLYRKLVTLLF